MHAKSFMALNMLMFPLYFFNVFLVCLSTYFTHHGCC